MNQKKSVKGLANIAQLLNRSDIPLHQPAPGGRRLTTADLVKKTLDNMRVFVNGSASDAQITQAHNERILSAAMQSAYNLGHAEALGQGSEVERLLEKQYDTRTRTLMPAVVCGIMEQLGLESMSLNLAHMATVFDRLDIQYTLDADTEVISYTARPVGDFHDGALAETFQHPEEIDPTDPRDKIDEARAKELLARGLSGDANVFGDHGVGRK